MSLGAARDFFSALNYDQRITALVLLVHQLTIAARDTYEFESRSVKDPIRLRDLNELQHAVANALLHTLEGSYEDDFFWSRLENASTAHEVEHAWSSVIRYLRGRGV